MSEFVEVVVKKAHTYDDVTYSAGDRYECRRRFFKALQALGRVDKYVEPEKPRRGRPRKSDGQETTATPRRGRYNRKDMAAD